MSASRPFSPCPPSRGNPITPPAREALATIKTASKEAVVELRSILGVLRHADDGDSAPRGPAPGLGALDELASRASAAGVDVTVETDIDPTDLPRAVDLAAYRIVQEALTNVARHADPPTATVAVHCRNGTLTVSVADRGRRRHHPAERWQRLTRDARAAASVGGTLVAGPG